MQLAKLLDVSIRSGEGVALTKRWEKGGRGKVRWCFVLRGLGAGRRPGIVGFGCCARVDRTNSWDDTNYSTHTTLHNCGLGLTVWEEN